MWDGAWRSLTAGEKTLSSLLDVTCTLFQENMNWVVHMILELSTEQVMILASDTEHISYVKNFLAFQLNLEGISYYLKDVSL